MKHISICISAYEMGGKGAEYLRCSFDKLTSQTFKDFEVIVSDQSKNNTIEDLCKEYRDKLDIHYFRESPLASPSENTNNALRRARGKLIKILFLDDFLYSDTSLETISKNFNANSDRWLLSASISTNNGVDFYRPFYPRYNDETILFKNTISAPSVVTLKNEDIVLFDDQLIWWQDLDFYKRCFERWGPPKILRDIGVAIRVHNNQMGNSSREEVREEEYRYILQKYHIPGKWRLLPVYKLKRYKRELKQALKKAAGVRLLRYYSASKKSIYDNLSILYYRITCFPLVIRFGTSDLSVFRQIFIKKQYAIDYGDLNPQLIIDGGANVGYTSIFMAQRFPAARIFSIEPEISNFKTLARNISMYQSITPLNKGLWPTSCNLNVVDSGQGAWAFMTTPSTKITSATVASVTIGDILEMSGADYIDILKLDIEGAEKELFTEQYETWLTKVRVLIIELHDRMRPGASQAFYAAIQKYGFTHELQGEIVIAKRFI